MTCSGIGKGSKINKKNNCFARSHNLQSHHNVIKIVWKDVGTSIATGFLAFKTLQSSERLPSFFNNVREN